MEIQKRLSEINHFRESISIDLQFLAEKFEEPWNVDNVSKKEIEDLYQKIRSLKMEANLHLKNLGVLIFSNNNLKDKAIALTKYLIQAGEQHVYGFVNIASKAINATTVGFIDEIGRRVSTIFPLGGSNIQDAMHDFEYARKNPYAEVLNSRKEITDKNLNLSLDRAEVPQNSKGVVYKPQSMQSQKVFHSNVIQNYIKENLETLINTNGNSLLYKDLGYKFFPEIDAYIAIQHFILHNPRITKDGYFEADLIDYYDFTERKIKTVPDLIKVPLNNTGHSLQETGLLQNYFEVYHIREKVW